MTFGISIDAEVWRRHCDAVRDRVHGADAALIPVIKGNGYGLGQALLAAEATRMGVRAIAIGTIHEVASVLDAFAGDVIVLEPVDPRDTDAVQAWQQFVGTDADARLIRTVASPEGLDFVLDTHVSPRVIIEARTSMRRFGFEGPALRESWAWAVQSVADSRMRLLGLTVHLPLEPTNADYDEILQLVDEVGDPSVHLLVSHMDVPKLEILKRHNPNLRFSLRIGTGLWLGARGALQAHGTVLAVHKVLRNDTMGYNGRTARSSGHVAVVAGGTAHGIGLEAPTPARSVRQRVISLAAGALGALGRAKSPFSLDGHDLWFVEPPHQHVSMLWVPGTLPAPAVGTDVAAAVRFTTTRADAVHLVQRG